MVWSSCEIVNNRLSSDWVREVSVERMGASWVELNWRLPCYRVAVAANYDHMYILRDGARQRPGPVTA